MFDEQSQARLNTARNAAIAGVLRALLSELDEAVLNKVPPQDIVSSLRKQMADNIRAADSEWL